MYSFGQGYSTDTIPILIEPQQVETIEEALLLLPSGLPSLSLEEIKQELQEKGYSRIACTTTQEWFIVV
jgi:hypothetical protein